MRSACGAAARDVVAAWIERHFDELARLFPSFIIGRVVRAVPALCDADRVRAAEAFLHPRAAKLEGVEKDLRQSVEEGLRCAALAGAQRAEAARWLRGRSAMIGRMRARLIGLVAMLGSLAAGGCAEDAVRAADSIAQAARTSGSCVLTWAEARATPRSAGTRPRAPLRADCGPYHVVTCRPSTRHDVLLRRRHRDAGRNRQCERPPSATTCDGGPDGRVRAADLQRAPAREPLSSASTAAPRVDATARLTSVGRCGAPGGRQLRAPVGGGGRAGEAGARQSAA